jgi:hypothetical protein
LKIDDISDRFTLEVITRVILIIRILLYFDIGMSKRKYKEYLTESVNPSIPHSTRHRMKKHHASSSEDGCSSHSNYKSKLSDNSASDNSLNAISHSEVL